MPFYEFYCSDCHLILNFFSRKVDTESIPKCPHCHEDIERLISTFAPIKGKGRLGDTGGFRKGDDPMVKNAYDKLNGKLANIDNSDPAVVAGILRQLGEETGQVMGPKMQNLLSQMEQNGYSEELHMELDSCLNEFEQKSEKEFSHQPKNNLVPPETDEEVYEL